MTLYGEIGGHALGTYELGGGEPEAPETPVLYGEIGGHVIGAYELGGGNPPPPGELAPANLSIGHALQAPGFSSIDITPGPTIGEVIFNYRPLSEVFDRLADLSNAWWRIDHDNVFHFRQRAAEPAPWTLIGADIIGTPSYTRSNPMYRNRQFIRGLKGLTDPQTFGPRAGTGVLKEWTVGFPLAKVPIVYVGGAVKRVDLKMFADTHSADFYWQKGDPVVVQDSNGVPLTASETITIVYQGEFNIIIQSENIAEQQRRREIEGGGSGIVESVDDDTAISSREVGLEKAAALLAKYGIEGEQLQFLTHRGGLAPGQVLRVYLPGHALDYDELLITDIATTRVRMATGFVYQRRVTAVLGPSIGSWAKFFMRMARPPSFIDALSVGEQTGLTIVNPLSDALAIEELVAFNTYACSFPSTSLYPETNLFPC